VLSQGSVSRRSVPTGDGSLPSWSVSPARGRPNMLHRMVSRTHSAGPPSNQKGASDCTSMKGASPLGVAIGMMMDAGALLSANATTSPASSLVARPVQVQTCSRPSPEPIIVPSLLSSRNDKSIPMELLAPTPTSPPETC
jgi:hypothetical protein